MEEGTQLLDRAKTWFRAHTSLIVAGIIATVVGGLILGWLLGGDEPQPPESTIASGASGAETGTSDGTAGAPQPVLQKPKSRREAIQQRSIWVAPPNMAPADEGRLFSSSGPIDFRRLDLDVISARDLVEDADIWEGELVLVLGEVAEQRDSPERFIPREFRLQGTDEAFDVYVAADDLDIARTGSVAYAMGEVVATGDTRDGEGGRRRSAYLSATFENGGTVASIGSVPRPIGSRAVRRGVARLGSP